MASTPVDDHTEEFEQLAGLAALDILVGDELGSSSSTRLTAIGAS
jgi:hypothetical protein